MSSRDAPAEASRSGRILLSVAFAFASGIVARGSGGLLAACAGLVIARFAWPAADAQASRLVSASRPVAPAGRRWRGRSGTLFLCAALAAGYAVAGLHAARDPTRSLLASWRRLGFEEGATPVRVRGVVTDVERLEDDRVALTLRLGRASVPAGAVGQARATPEVGVRLTLPWPGLQPIPWNEGETIETVARIGRPRRFRNPGSFDYPTYLATRGIGLTGTVKSALLVERLAESVAPWSGLLPRARRQIVAALQDAAGAPRPPISSRRSWSANASRCRPISRRRCNGPASTTSSRCRDSTSA